MKLLYLSKIGRHYDGEEGTPGVRLGALSQLETLLKQALTDLRNLGTDSSRALPLPPSASNFERARHAQEQAIRKQKFESLSPQEKMAIHKKNEQRQKLQERIQRLKLWLQLENAIVKPDGSIDWSLSDKNVVYDHDPVLREMTRLRLHAGKIYKDDLHTQPFDTKNLVTHFSGPGKAIYVMTASGAIHASSHSVGYRHHSSLLAGKSIAGAGELEVLGGELKWISNKSGHYQPNIKHFLQTLHTLEKGGISNTFRITYFSSAGKRDYINTAAFQSGLTADQEPYFDFEFNKLMLYSEWLDDAILGQHTPHPWRWRIPPNEEPSVYDTITSLPVPHRDVRKWLKSTNRHMTKDKQSGAGR